ncbi:MAG: ABC transporter ATP-binding protein [Oscillospiraceae bacterium]|nr:ABC transporter ATP-binding protein [Oscillospiraceae bacterium]MBP3521078.1 ABC transporter ATP-binding protein [Oscillospiraceae bacterium]
MKNAIEVKHLTKKYQLFTLDDVSFTVPGGTIVGLIGENGAGKSTTLKCILNLIRRDGGEIALLEKDNIRDERAVKEDIGVVLDDTGFHDTLTADMVGNILSHIYQKWDKNLYQELLKRYDLPKNLFLKEFSKGMKMKLSIAAALAHHPKLLILDEPTSGLDPVVRDEILDEFFAFIRDEDHAILMSSHITTDLEKVADTIVYLHKGKVLLQGEKDLLLEQYGKLLCSKEELDGVDKTLLGGVRENQFGCEALVKDRAELKRRYPGLTVDPVSLDDIMVLTVKGEQK